MNYQELATRIAHHLDTSDAPHDVTVTELADTFQGATDDDVRRVLDEYRRNGNSFEHHGPGGGGGWVPVVEEPPTTTAAPQADLLPQGRIGSDEFWTRVRACDPGDHPELLIVPGAPGLLTLSDGRQFTGGNLLELATAVEEATGRTPLKPGPHAKPGA